MNTRRALTAATLAVAVTGLLAGAAAWACTASAELSASPTAGAAGSQTTVTGYRFDTTTPVEIRWATRGGPVLATTTGPNFSVEVTVPANAAVGDYVIVGMNTGGSFAPATPFRVTSSGSTATSSSGSKGSRTGSISGGGGQSSTPAADTGSPAPTTDEAVAAPSPDTATGGNESGRTLASPASGVGRAPASTKAQGTSTRNGASTTPATGQSVDASGSRLATPGAADEQSSAPEAGAPSVRSATSDIWGGFATGDESVRGPSLSADVPATGSGPSSLAVGIGLLSLGTVALSVGAGVTVMRRRRLAHSA